MASAKILIVEDENIVARHIQNKLKGLGYTIAAVASSGEEAVEKAAKTHPELVLMDIHLKGRMDGVEAAEKIHDCFNIPVIYLTAHSDDNTLQRAKVTEPFGYLLKPFEERELHTTIEMALYKHRMEKRLKESEERYRLLFESNPYPMWVYDLETLSFLAVNDATVQHYGYSQEEFQSMTLKDIHPPQDVPLLLDHISKIAQKVDWMGVWKHRKKNGTLVDVKIISRPLIFGGRAARLVLANDITEYRRSEELYKMLLETIPSSFLLIDQNLSIILANKNFLMKAHRSESDTIGRQLREVFPKVIIDEMGLERRIRQVFQSNMATQGQRLTYRAPGVPMRVYYYSIIPVTWSGRVESVMLLMDDVTEQILLSKEIRRVERHLVSVVESASDIVLSTDMEGRILTWNRAAEKISGYTLDEVKGRFFFEFCARDFHQKVKMLFSNMEIQGKSSDMAEGDLVTKQGSFISVSWVFSPMKDDQAQTMGVVAVGRDLTERHKFEMQLLQSQKLAALGVMAGGIAHEIRNPLAIASSATQFLMEDEITPEFRKECAEKIHMGIQRASVIVENLLRFARPSAKSNMTQVNLLSVLDDALMLITNQAKIQNIELKTCFPKEPVWIIGIANLLEQVFMNLFLNALNAMPNGGILSISIERIGSEVLIRVIDTGQGISSENIGNIFDPFYTTSPVGKGTGLGLSICYSIVKQHLGSIEVDSVKGKGSTFTVRLPLL